MLPTVALNATELLLLAVAMQLALFAIGWTVAAFTLDIERVTLRGFLAFNVSVSLAFSYIALRQESPSAIERTLPNLLILAGMFSLAKAIHAYWGLNLGRVSIATTVAAMLGVVWFGMIERHDALRVGVLLVGFLWLVVVCMARTYRPTRDEFGVAAANALTVVAIVVLVTMSWRIYLVAFTQASTELNQPSRFSELGIYVMMLAASGPNLLYGYFVCVRLVRSANRVADSDGLTRLLNHRAFMLASERSWHERRVNRQIGCVLAVDIDHFKQVNDKHGHQAGDAVLSMFGSLLNSTFAKGCIVGRTGGEEFIVVVEGANEEKATELAEQLVRSVKMATWPASNQEKIQITVSVGVALDAPHDLRANDLLLRADRALYTAKQNGRDRIEFA